MGLRENLADPWAGLVAAVAGGLTWAVIPATAGLAVPLGLGVAAAVYGVKVAASTLLSRGGEERGSRELTPPPRGTAAFGWLDRTERASRALRELVTTAGDGPTRERLNTVSEQASMTLDGMRRLASRATAVERAMARIPASDLADDRGRLAATVDSADSTELRAEHQNALDSVEEQLAVYRRLSAARDSLLARMQSTALGLEGLNARAVELLAMSTSEGGQADARLLDELSDELEAMRVGQVEVEELTRRTLAPGEGSPPGAPKGTV